MLEHGYENFSLNYFILESGFAIDVNMLLMKWNVISLSDIKIPITQNYEVCGVLLICM